MTPVIQRWVMKKQLIYEYTLITFNVTCFMVCLLFITTTGVS